MSDIKITVADRAGRKCASSGSKWEPIMGYSRAVRSGNTIAVTGCVGINADGTYDPDSASRRPARWRSSRRRSKRWAAKWSR